MLTVGRGWNSLCLPATYCTVYYGFKRMKEEQGLLIQQKKKIMDAAGTRDFKVEDQHLSH